MEFLSDSSLPFNETGRFSRLFTDYVQQAPGLRPFFGRHPLAEGAFSAQWQEKRAAFSPESRRRLVDTLHRQMVPFGLHSAQSENFGLLENSDTVSVSCGHQLCIGGGPQFVAFKLLETVQLARHLRQSGIPAVPVFWMASEDHDLEEISVLRYEEKEYRFSLTGQAASGKTPGTGISEALAQIPGFPAEMARAYQDAANLAEATRNWIQTYFGETGILVLDADEASLKNAFFPWLARELKGDFSDPRIQKTSSELEALGYKAQVHSRALNVFHLSETQRIRLENRHGRIQTLDGRDFGTVDEALAYFEKNPAELSPNVCLRPLYSQVLLPDVAFVGGPAEMAYWLQLKGVFDEAGVPFPVLIPRLSGMFIPRPVQRKLEKLGLEARDLFLPEGVLKKKVLPEVAELDIPDPKPLLSGLLQHAREADPSLVAAVESEGVKIEKQLEGLTRRIRKAYENKEEVRLNQLKSILERLFPDGDLQERKESWLSRVVLQPDWIEDLGHRFEPLDFRFHVFFERPSDGGGN